MLTRIHGVRAAIDLVPIGSGPSALVGELRDEHNQPLRAPGDRPSRPGRELDRVVVLDTSARGLGLLLAGLERLAGSRPVRAVRRAG